MEPTHKASQVASHRQPESSAARSLEASVVLLKVGIALAGWMAVFLITFLGYLTLPAIVLFAFLVIYTIVDFIGKRMRRARARR